MITAVAIFVIGPIAQKVTARFDALSTALVAMGPVDHNTAIAQTTGATGSAGQQTSVSAFINTNSGTSIGGGSSVGGASTSGGTATGNSHCGSH